MRNVTVVVGVVCLCVSSITLTKSQADAPDVPGCNPKRQVTYLHLYKPYFPGHRLNNFTPSRLYVARQHRAPVSHSTTLKQHERYFDLHAANANWRYSHRRRNVNLS